MVRTSGGIRISAGKSSKKGGGGGSGGSSRSTSSSSTSKSSGANRLPPIPHCEAPSWQKPITNFFNSDAGHSKGTNVKAKETEENAGCNQQKEGNSKEYYNKIADTEDAENNDDNTSNDGEPSEKKTKVEDIDKENIDNNIPSSSA